MYKLFFIWLFSFLFLNYNIAGQKIRYTLIVDNVEREYFLHIPSSYSGDEAVPLVFMLHGTSGDGEKMYETSGWAELAESEGFIAAFPSSMRYKIITGGEYKTTTKWNTPPDCEWIFQDGETGKDDIKFLRKVAEEIRVNYKIDATRIYLNGFSNGGQMAAKCSIEMGDILAAVCSNAVSFYLDTFYVAKRKLPYLFEVGDKDYGPGNEGPEFPAIPMMYFDSLISIPDLNYQNGKHYTIVKDVTRNFSLKTQHEQIVGDTNFAIYTTYLPVDPNDSHEFKFVFVKDLGHSYPNWSPAAHWQWMKKYKLTNTSIIIDKSELDFNVWPNPVNDILFIDNNLIGEYRIMSMGGKWLLSGSGKQIDVTSLVSGIYILSFIQGIMSETPNLLKIDKE